jgi:ABC-type glycerol-3-phosphate transport system permease component
MRLDGEYVKQWGELMAGYTISSIPLVLLFLFTMKLFVKGLTAGAIKG